MSYRPNRLTIGYERAKVLNPWVFADLRQPQRMRGFVSPLVYQTSPPTVYHPNLSGLGTEEVGAEQPVTQLTVEEEQRAIRRGTFELQRQSAKLAKRMALLTAVTGLVGVVVSVAGLAITYADRRQTNRS
jgi:hypothetical protein